jgi:hypothetical protein
MVDPFEAEVEIRIGNEMLGTEIQDERNRWWQTQAVRLRFCECRNGGMDEPDPSAVPFCPTIVRIEQRKEMGNTSEGCFAHFIRPSLR